MHVSMATDPRTFLDELNRSYVRLHGAKEDAFWRAMTGVSDDPDAARRDLDAAEIELGRFLQDPELLARVRAVRGEAAGDGANGGGLDEDDLVALAGWERTLAAHAIESAEARALAEEIVEREGRLARARSAMPLSYADPARGPVRASSVRLGVLVASDPDERLRRAAWEGLRSIEPFVLERGFLELVRERNRLGRMLGAEDYYDWKVRRAEGTTKAEVFALLDELEERTREAAARSLDALASRAGRAALEPWNVRFLAGGDAKREEDPWFPFAGSVERWGRSFAALGIAYDGATLVLDLVDREGKYENGFMHGPVVSWSERGHRHRARIHFTANAIPGMVGSGARAVRTLFHEGGHAAHFANVDMPAPCFGQEFAPTSVAFAETQSMLLDSLLEDADWRARYARDEQGDPLPAEVLERGIAARQSLAAWEVRARLAVCYAERALYELDDGELSAERVLAALRDVERRLLLLEGGSPRPALAVPHLLAGESSAYYHGYLLAEMAVHGARAHFFERDGHLVDSPRVGPELRDVWWRPGNSKPFAELVSDLTGEPPGARRLADALCRTPDEAVAEGRAAVERLRDVPPHEGPVELDARIRVVHGRETVAELDGEGFDAFARRFGEWARARAEREREAARGTAVAGRGDVNES